MRNCTCSKQKLENAARLCKAILTFLVNTELNSSANSNNELFLVYECQHLITSITQFTLSLSSPWSHVRIKFYRTADHSLEERETSCIRQALKITTVKKAERTARKMLCFPQRNLLHYVLLLEIEAKVTRWAPLMGPGTHSCLCKVVLM